MTGTYGVGVVGLGQIAQIMHLPYLTELPGFEVRAVCDLSPSVTASVADQYGVSQRYTDYHDLLKQPDVDVVLVCTLDHAEIVIAAAEAGKHIVVEKPMCFNLEEADEIIRAVTAKNVKLMVSYMKRYDPGYQWALERFRAMENIRLVRVHDLAGDFSINNEIYDLFTANDIPQSVLDRGRETSQRSMIQAIGEDRAHLVDAYSTLLGLTTHDSIILRQAFGEPSRVMFADVYERNFVVATLEYENGMRCVWESGILTGRKFWDESLTAYSSDQAVEVRFPFPYLKNAATMVFVNEMEDGAAVDKQVVASFDGAFKREWRHLHDCLSQNCQPITNAEEGRADVALMIELIKAVPVAAPAASV
ncbi:MAG: Gfo/Idh/MocA family oxidoreductase [Thermomicrobiales bacterium]